MKVKGLLAAVLLCLFFSSCISGFFDDKPEGVEGKIDPFTIIETVLQGRANLRNNLNATNSHAVNVYLTYDKQKPIATVPALGNVVVPVNPNQNQHFYFTYLLKVVSGGKEVNLEYTPTEYSGGVTIASIVESTQPTPVLIPSLHDVIVNSGQPDKLNSPLTKDIYFSINNATAFMIFFNVNNNPETGLNESSNIHQGQQTRIYRVDGNSASLINTNSTNIEDVTTGNKYYLNTAGVTFQQGHFYDITYSAGGNITVTGQFPINIANTGVSFTERNITFNINGGTGFVPASIKGAPGLQLDLPGQGQMSRSGFTFGGWNENTQGTGANYTTSIVVPDRDLTLFARWLAPLGVPINIFGSPTTGSTSSSITVTWSSVSGATGYVVYCYLNPDDAQQHRREVVTGGSTTSLQMAGLQSETIYFFRVAATNSSGEGRLSEMSLPVRTTTGDGSILNIVGDIQVGGLYQGDILFGHTQYISVNLLPGTYRFSCVDSDNSSASGYADILTGLANENGSIVVPIEDRWSSNPINTFDHFVTTAGTFLIAVRCYSAGIYEVKVEQRQ